MPMPMPMRFVLNGVSVVVDADAEGGESLLNVLRERLGVVSAKDGCAPSISVGSGVSMCASQGVST